MGIKLLKKKTIISLLLAFVLCITYGTTAYANMSNQTFTWYQETGTIAKSNGQVVGYIMDEDISSTSQITVEGIATSPKAGEFELTLQRKKAIGWADVTYTVKQHSKQTYSLRQGHNVTGQYFKLVFATTGGTHRYRIKLSGATKPQVAVFTQFYVYGN